MQNKKENLIDLIGGFIKFQCSICKNSIEDEDNDCLQYTIEDNKENMSCGWVHTKCFKTLNWITVSEEGNA